MGPRSGTRAASPRGEVSARGAIEDNGRESGRSSQSARGQAYSHDAGAPAGIAVTPPGRDAPVHNRRENYCIDRHRIIQHPAMLESEEQLTFM